MRLPEPKTIFKLNQIFMALIMLFVINSCHKDNKNSSPPALSPVILQAKAWYENTYPAAAVNNNKLATQSSGTSNLFDFSKHTRPDWQHPASYLRQGSNVIEIPIDPATPFNMSISNTPGGAPVYNKRYSRTSFLLLNDGANYTAYVMTIIADSAYIGNDLSKLDHNKYNKHDLDFTGIVLYFTPTGEFVSSWFYKNGALINPPSAASKGTNTGGEVIQSLKSNLVEVCTDWYEQGSYTDANGNVVSTGLVYLDTTCIYYDVSGGGSTGTITNPGTPPTTGGGTPPPCPVSNSVNAVNNSTGGHLTTNQVQQPPPTGDDGGFPPPTGSPSPCSVTKPPVKPTIDMLMKNPNSLTAAQKAQLQAVLDQMLLNCEGQALFNYFSNNGIKFDFEASPASAAAASYNPSTGAINIQNTATLVPDNLEEEFFHAYQNANYPGGTAQYGPTKVGSANIEFEAKVMHDITVSVTGLGTFFGGGNFDSPYGHWISSLTNHDYYPVSFTATQQSQYFQYMSAFVSTVQGYNLDIVNSNLNPTAMFKLIISSPCNN